MANVTIGGIVGGEDTSPAGTAKIEIETGGVSKYAQLVNILKNGIPIGGTTPAEGTFTQMKWAKGVDVASASTLTLGSDGNYFDVTGTTTITSIATLGVGSFVILHFDGALVLTHHATDLVLPGGANITTAAGDEAMFEEYATGKWRCVNYQRASGQMTNANQPAFLAYNSSTDENVTGDGTEVTVGFDTETFDQGGDFASNVFTAPVAGRYLLSCGIMFTGIDNTALLVSRLVTSNRSYYVSASYASRNEHTLITTVIADMDASDTAHVTAMANYCSGKVVDIFGSTTMYTFFSGCLLC